MLSEHEDTIPVMQCLLSSYSLYPDVQPTSRVAMLIFLLIISNLAGTISMNLKKYI